METQAVRHYQVNQRYRVVFERAASTKGVIGFKVEANGDSAHDTFEDVLLLKQRAELYAVEPGAVLKEQGPPQP